MIYISDLRSNLEEVTEVYLRKELGVAWQFFINDNNFGKPVKYFKR